MAASVGIRVLRAFGAVLRECRKTARISQQKLGEASGLNRKFISSLENAHQEPGLGTLLKLSRALRVKVGEMLNRTEQLVLPASLLKRIELDTESKIPLGPETCPGCKAVYALHARRLKTRERGRFKCPHCSQQLASWLGTTTFIYELTRMPKSRRAK